MVQWVMKSTPVQDKPTGSVLRSRYDDVYPVTVKNDDQFNGNLQFEFSQSANEIVDWGNTFFEFRIDLHDQSNAIIVPYLQNTVSGAAVPPSNVSGSLISGQISVAPLIPNYNAVGSLFSQFIHVINGSTTVSSQTEYRTADTHNKRVQTKYQQGKTWGSTTLLERDPIQRTINCGWASASGAAISNVNRYYTQAIGQQITTQLYQPSVGLWGNDIQTYGQMRHMLQFTIDPNYKRNFVTASGNPAPSTAYNNFASWNVVIKEVILHVNYLTTDMPYASGEHYESVAHWTAMQNAVTAQTNTLTWQVPASTYRVSYFEQSGAVGTDVTYSSTNFSASGVEILMTRAPRIRYAGMQFPTIDRTFTISTTNTGPTPNEFSGPQTSYLWTQQAFGYDAEDGEATESFLDWLQLGALYSARFDKSLADNSTQLQVDVAHSVSVSGASNVLGWIVSQSDKQLKFTYSNGVVTSVEVYDA